ncbi:ABC transporter substrate-binding protein [Saccharomonospora sp. NPDC046836]|uniref:ABC transporter substrate-binding protein n=1 Tax=Saccharomonospora sp. NPDC046836 TaxID=3156921 RepID=UPI0033EE342F
MNRKSGLSALGRALGLGVALVLLAACGGGSSGSGTGEPGEPLKVVTLQVSDFLLPYLAEKQGLFQREGVNVELEPFTGGTQVQLPKVVSGDYDIGTGSSGDLLPSVTRGIPVSAIAGVGATATGDLAKSTQAMIYKDPAITRPRDLAGRTVGLNSIGGSLELYIRATVEQDGGDPATINFVQIPVQNIPSAVDSGQLDVGQGFEPYLSVARSMGLKELFSPSQIIDGLPSVVYFGKKDVLSSRAADVAAFSRAMQAAAKMANTDPELMRDVVREHTQTDPTLLAGVKNFGNFTESMSPDKFTAYAEFAHAHQQIDRVPTAEEWVYVPTS